MRLDMGSITNVSIWRRIQPAFLGGGGRKNNVKRVKTGRWKDGAAYLLEM